MFEELKDEVDNIKRGLGDFTSRFEAGLFIGKPELLAKHVELGRMDVLNFAARLQEALVAFETQTDNAIKLCDDELSALKAAVTHLQDALSDPAVAAEIVRARQEEKVREAAARGHEFDSAAGAEAGTQSKVGSGG